MQLRSKTVRDALALASRNLYPIFLRRQIPNHHRRIRRTRGIQRADQRAADDLQGYGLGFMVGNVEDGAGGVAVDELDAEDFGLGEGGFDVDGEDGGLEFGFVGGDFFH